MRDIIGSRNILSNSATRYRASIQALADISRSALFNCHSNETRASSTNPPNSAQLTNIVFIKPLTNRNDNIQWSSLSRRTAQRHSIYNAYIAPCQNTHKALRHGSHSFTCKLHHACLLFRKRSPDSATSKWGGRHLMGACYSFIDPEGMRGWVGLVGWPIAGGLPT